MNKNTAPPVVDAKPVIGSINCYVAHYTPSTDQQAILSEQNLSETPPKHQYVERTVFTKDVNTQTFSTLELGSQKALMVLIWMIV